MTRLAAELGLTRSAAQRAHRQYLQQVAAAAWRDGQVTKAERADLLEVAHLPGVDSQEALAILQDAVSRAVLRRLPLPRAVSSLVTGWSSLAIWTSPGEDRRTRHSSRLARHQLNQP